MEEDKHHQTKSKQILQFGDNPNCELYRKELITANRLFKQQKFIEAAKQYRKYIECNFDPNCQIDGFGNY